MSNIIKRMAKRARSKADKPKSKPAYQPPKRYTSFNIFTSDGQNITVESKKPMTIYEAQDHFKALSISGNE